MRKKNLTTTSVELPMVEDATEMDYTRAFLSLEASKPALVLSLTLKDSDLRKTSVELRAVE